VQADAAIAATQTKFDFTDTAAKEKENFLKQLQDKTLAVYNALDAAIKTDLGTNKGVDNTSFATLNTTFLAKITPFFNSIFEARLKEAFLSIPLILPPSPAVAGVYASVDRNRGVWKAPANVSLNSVKKPEVQLSDLDQEDFNVDAENGKSINCIRQFVGRGNLVWGARTLAGNNNEWRYVNVRRFFNMVEESCQNAARQFVFEPNDANTWVRVKGMIDNYLTNLWRVGALQGAKPEHAFYTAVGLNQTMTQDDILNGLLIVEIGLAVVRPAEFIILRFSHKLAVS
jgi:phage tail sheath protein FI